MTSFSFICSILLDQIKRNQSLYFIISVFPILEYSLSKHSVSSETSKISFQNQMILWMDPHYVKFECYLSCIQIEYCCLASINRPDPSHSLPHCLEWVQHLESTPKNLLDLSYVGLHNFEKIIYWHYPWEKMEEVCCNKMTARRSMRCCFQRTMIWLADYWN